MERAYASIPAASFSDSVLAALPALLAVSTLPSVTWSDWGTPERVMETLRREGLVPNWFEAPPASVSGHQTTFRLAPSA